METLVVTGRSRTFQPLDGRTVLDNLLASKGAPGNVLAKFEAEAQRDQHTITTLKGQLTPNVQIVSQRQLDIVVDSVSHLLRGEPSQMYRGSVIRSCTSSEQKLAAIAKVLNQGE